ncbi:MAG: hypothetical protein ABUS79_28805 [Pseudomonadota bacterium]
MATAPAPTPARRGGMGAACCGGNGGTCDSGLACTAPMTGGGADSCQPCGAVGQRCCPNMGGGGLGTCGTGAQCAGAGIGGGATCQACGASGQACCGTGTVANRTCTSGTCMFMGGMALCP